MMDYLIYIAAAYFLAGASVGYWHLVVCRRCQYEATDLLDIAHYVLVSALVAVPLLIISFAIWILEPCIEDANGMD